MKYGKIRIEDGYLIFTKHMMINSLPCKDILWAYKRRESREEVEGKRLVSNYLVIHTKRHKRYQFDMTEREVHDCIQILRALNPDMAVGFSQGERLALQSLYNTRDLGGIMTSDGRYFLPRRLLRSGDLYHVSQADQEALLRQYHVSTVVDFRSEEERMERPDTYMEGIRYISLPVLEEGMLGISEAGGLGPMLFQFRGNIEEYMEQQYASLVSDQLCLNQFARFFDILLHQEEGAVLYHCTEGKDITGVATALLLYVLGVPKRAIREEFMRTNEFLAEETQHILEFLATRMDVDEKTEERLCAFLSVKESYIDTVFRTIQKEYGTFQHFLRRVLYLTPKAIDELQEKYLI